VVVPVGSTIAREPLNLGNQSLVESSQTSRFSQGAPARSTVGFDRRRDSSSVRNKRFSAGQTSNSAPIYSAQEI
jgi:hypothetical protein